MKNKKVQNGMHINLLLKDRKCLVIGGGKVALHKIQLLLNAEADVHVISPELHKEVEALLHAKKVTYQNKEFEALDITNVFLVYAATDSRGANRAVLDACRSKNILCCCVDGNWSDADFITPATTKHGHLTLSISSGGVNCRQSKLVKNSLSRHMSFLQTAHLIIIGSDHRHLSVEERERLYLSAEKYEKTGMMINQLLGVHEFMILNTCNRTEIIAVASAETLQHGILNQISGFSMLSPTQFYIKKNEKAFEHLCLVTAGILSQTPGENHITAQVKASLEEAKSYHWADNMLQEWVSSALFISKDIKNEINSNMKGEEIESLTLRYLISQNMTPSYIMIIGSGFLGQNLIREASLYFPRIIWCYHENKPNLSAEQKSSIELVNIKNISKHLSRANIIISANSSYEYLLKSSDRKILDHAPTYIVDLSVPRTIDPELASASNNIKIINLDGLKKWKSSESNQAYDFVSASQSIIKKHIKIYEKIIHNFQGRN